MENNLVDKILEQSKFVNEFWKDKVITPETEHTIIYPISSHHKRFHSFTSYPFHCRSIQRTDFRLEDLIIIDQHLLGTTWLTDLLPSSQNIIPLSANESTIKEINFLNGLLANMHQKPRIVGIGGGIILNVVGYLAEHLQADLTYIPTTPISMSDSSMGGKVRVNEVSGGQFKKHFYKSFYEPNTIIVDIRFLDTLVFEHLSWGLAEIVKHALYQSPSLLTYLLSDDFDPRNTTSLFKAIMWCADLKRICLDVDPDETPNGSCLIIRAGHDLSDQIEEDSHFTISHGEAVWKGMGVDLQNQPERKAMWEKLKEKLLSRNI